MNDGLKVLRIIKKDKNFEVTDSRKKNSYKIVCTLNGSFYFYHLSKRHFKPLLSWYNKK